MKRLALNLLSSIIKRVRKERSCYTCEHKRTKDIWFRVCTKSGKIVEPWGCCEKWEAEE